MRTILKNGEQLIIEVKRHWISLMAPFLISAGSVTGFLVLLSSYPSLSQFRSVGGIILVAAPAYFLYKFYEREVDIWALTNVRVIDEWGVFTRNTRESPLERINNVSYKQPLLGILLGYGDVTIQTAADHGDTTIGFANRPKLLKDAIAKAQAESHEGVQHHASQRKEPLDDDEREELTECPWCAEKIKAKARICRYCQRETKPPVSEDKNKEEGISK